MNQDTPAAPALRLHLTNVAGAGATQLLLSLLPAFERHENIRIAEIYLPGRGRMADYPALPGTVRPRPYRRFLPNALSRLLECTVLARRFDGEVPLLVLGDLPLRCHAQQTVFVQTPHLARPGRFCWSRDGIRFAVSRLVFRLNARYADAFIVQTSVMRDLLMASYPDIADRVHVIAQPVPSWLLASPARRSGRRMLPGDRLRLIYPAALYPHKNHRLLANLTHDRALSLPIERLRLTIPPVSHPAADITWIDCVGFLSAPEMIAAYNEADAVLFLSTAESYGFPLVEAMFLGLPIVCPDLPYARTLCAEGAIYFDPSSIDSLAEAIGLLQKRLVAGWWPDWSAQLAGIPENWASVASQMINVALVAQAN
jgi:glycosyltransferase involved in cell wall biosynthesis